MKSGILYDALTDHQRESLYQYCLDFRSRDYFLFRSDPVFQNVKDIIGPLIEFVEGRDTFYKAIFLTTQEYGATIHVDEYRDRNASNTYIFPLEIQPIDPSKPFQTSTIVFEQSYYSEYRPDDDRDDVSEFWKTAPDVYPNAEGLPPEYLGHAVGYPGVSLKKINMEACFRWKLNAMMFFPRNRLHSSNNLSYNNVAEKKALVVFTTNDDIDENMR